MKEDNSEVMGQRVGMKVDGVRHLRAITVVRKLNGKKTVNTHHVYSLLGWKQKSGQLRACTSYCLHRLLEVSWDMDGVERM